VPRTSSQVAVLAIILTSYFMILLDNSVVFTGLPSIREDLELSGTALSWVQDAYVLVFGGLLLLGARAGDIVGRRRLFEIGLVVFGGASLLIGLAPTGWWMIAARALQGVGAAIVAPTSLALITAYFEGEARSRAVAWYAATAGIGASLGLLVGGALTDLVSWRAAFLVNVPIAIAMVAGARAVLPETPRLRGSFDVVGALCATLGMGALVLGIIESGSTGWGSAQVLVPIALGVVLLAALVVNESRVAQPIMPLRLFRSRERSGAYGARLLYLGAMIGFFFFTTQYLQDALGFTPLQAGLGFLPMSLVNFAVALAVPRLGARISDGVLLAGGSPSCPTDREQRDLGTGPAGGARRHRARPPGGGFEGSTASAWIDRHCQRTERAPSMECMSASFTLNNGVEIPAVGFGVFQTPPDETVAAVETALATGYRHIDTAAAYGNEREVGEAIRRSGLDRAELFVETKVWITDYGYDATLHAFDKSAGKLGMDRIDLLILHQALPGEFELTLDAYRALEQLLADGKVRAIGVSNFMPAHLTRLLAETSVVPAVNQIEVHPYFRQSELLAADAEHGILSQAWSPIGGITFYRDGSHGSTLQDPTIGQIAAVHGKTPAQVMLRWHVQEGRQVIPKSVTPSRIAENFDVLDFELTGDQLAAIDALDTGVRGGPEPEQITRETFGLVIPEA
jgi:2,5-diketo-D-gluconate reductase A